MLSLNDENVNMLTLYLPDMSCGHCKKAIESAVNAIDESATLNFDMDKKMVTIDSKAANGEVIKAVAQAGYSATEV